MCQGEALYNSMDIMIVVCLDEVELYIVAIIYKTYYHIVCRIVGRPLRRIVRITENIIYHYYMIETCMSEGYKQVWIKVSTYNKLKKLSEKTGKSIVRLIDDLVNGANEPMGFDENTIRKIVKEEITKAFDEIKTMLLNIFEKS